MSAKKDVKRGKKLDLFCWKCHKTETNIGCSRCERSFHTKCISMTKNIKDFAPNWVCNECVDTCTQTNCPLDSIQLQQMMLLSLKMISKSADYYFNSDNCFVDKRIKVNSNLIVNPLNLKKIEVKINDFEYKCFGEMTSDFKWLSHNCIVAKLESGLLENAKFLLSKVKSEQKDFEECVHCFINYYKTSKTQYYSWFSKPCPQMHPIVWAKVRGHPYWPSKVIKPNQQSGSVLVRFFGTHQKSCVKEKDCYLISEESPKALTGKGLQMAPLLNSALEEMKYNIKYLSEEYPNWFQFSPKFTPFSLKDMVDNNDNHLNTTKPNDNHLMDRPIGWKPKARKTFPTPTNSSSHKLEAKPIEITFKGSNDNKKSKSDPNLEIILFNSERSAIKREHNYNESIDKQIEVKSERFEYISHFSKNIKIGSVEPIKTQSNADIKPKEEILVERKVEAKKQKLIKSVPESDMNKTLKCLQQRVKGLEKMIEIKDKNYSKQIMEMQQKSDLALEQMRRSLEIDKQRAVIEERNKQIAINNEKLNHRIEEKYQMNTSFETQSNQLIEKHKLKIKCLEEKFDKELSECKTKIWCFNCLKEAQLYCCSHTYYCSNECQLTHWEHHKQICVQKP